jgi:hypothetical protein
MPVVRFGGEVKRRGESGVKRAGGCNAVSGRGGDAGAVRARASGGPGGGAVGFLRRKKLGRAHTAVRGEGGGGWAGRRPRLGGEGGRWLGLGSGPVADHTSRAEKGRRPGRNHCSG